MADIVKMKRLEPQFPCGPVEAEVHPDEVDGMKSCDWYVDGEQAEGTKPAKGKKSAEAEQSG